MKRVKSLDESRKEIRKMFKSNVAEMFGAKQSIKGLTLEQLLQSIRKTAEQVTIVHVPEGLNEFTAIKTALKEEIGMALKGKPEWKSDVQKVWKGEQPVSETAPAETPAEPVTETPAEMVEVKQTKKAVNPGRKSLQEALPGEQVDLNKMMVAGIVYVGILTDARDKFIKAKSVKSWQAWVEDNYFRYKGDVVNGKKITQPQEEEPRQPKAAVKTKKEVSKPAPSPKKTTAPTDMSFDMERKENETSDAYVMRVLMTAVTDEDLKKVAAMINQEKQVVLMHTKSAQPGIITEVHIGQSGRPYYIVTLKNKKTSVAFSAITDRYFTAVTDPQAYAEIEAMINKQ